MNNNDVDYSFLGVEGLTGNRMVRVTNMGRNVVAYTLPELNNTRREFRPSIDGQQPESKSISFHELYILANKLGGEQLIWDNLLIEDNDVRIALGLPTTEETPEAKYTRDEVFEILKKGNRDEILDMLEFGPFYIAQWVKEDVIALDSRATRDLIGEVFQINVDKLEETTRWAAEDELADQLGYSTIRGIKTSKGSVQRGDARKRRSSTEDVSTNNSTTEVSGGRMRRHQK